MSQSYYGTDPFVDSEDLMSWLLLSPELDALTGNYGLPMVEQQNSTESHNGYDHPAPVNNADYSGGSTSGNGYIQNGYPQMMENSSFSYLQPSSHSNSDGFAVPPPINTKVKREAMKREPSPTTDASYQRVSKIQRKRPRESLDDLENRVKELKAENADLHAHLLNVTQRTTEVQKQRVAMERLMAGKLSEVEERMDADQTELAEIVKQYTDLYADYGKCRQREVAFHLQQLEKLIVPTQTTKMCLWTLHQEKSSEKVKSPMFNILAKELEITPEQSEKIFERRERISVLLAQLRETLNLLQKLKVNIVKKHACYDQICGRVQSAASAKQVVKFLVWITNHAEALSKYIQGFNRSIHHIPNVEFVNKFTSECSVNNGEDETLKSSSESK